MDVSTKQKAITGATNHERALRQAIAITPYDSGAYALRAVATLAAEGSAVKALADVAKALEYDPTNRDARTTLDRLSQLSKSSTSTELPPMLFRRDFQGASGATCATTSNVCRASTARRHPRKSWRESYARERATDRESTSLWRQSEIRLGPPKSLLGHDSPRMGADGARNEDRSPARSCGRRSSYLEVSRC